jgi:hypothetical protein
VYGASNYVVLPMQDTWKRTEIALQVKKCCVCSFYRSLVFYHANLLFVGAYVESRALDFQILASRECYSYDRGGKFQTCKEKLIQILIFFPCHFTIFLLFFIISSLVHIYYELLFDWDDGWRKLSIA